ncbi:hypothetical protein N2152v2_003424 [Parachlorella kessleri]
MLRHATTVSGATATACIRQPLPATQRLMSIAGEAVEVAKGKLQDLVGDSPPEAEIKSELPAMMPEEGFEGGLDPAAEERAASESQQPNYKHSTDYEKAPGEPDVPAPSMEEDFKDSWSKV